MGNTICVTGNLVADAEVKQFGDNRACVFKVANNHYFKKEKQTQYFDCVSFQRLAVDYSESLSKGKQITVSGELHTELVESNGKTYLNMNITCDRIAMPPKGDDAGAQQPAQNNTPLDDDIPF